MQKETKKKNVVRETKKKDVHLNEKLTDKTTTSINKEPDVVFTPEDSQIEFIEEKEMTNEKKNNFKLPAEVIAIIAIGVAVVVIALLV